ncbi:hypothetical protein [Kocuria aegyptia]|uniref:MFS transporter n=1 Tax=Kocuria aegyptia TaxID=330943 RepID=A0ABN2KDD6_9MICC
MEQHGPVRPGARWVRGWLAAFLSTVCAGLSHYIADASAPDPALLMCALAAAGVVCGLLAGRRMGPARMAAAVALSQGVYHALFSVPSFRSAAAPGEAMTSHVHHGAAMVPGAPLTSGAEAPSGMLAAHVLAGILTFWVLQHGERSWWALVDALRTEVGVVLALVLPLIPAARPPRRAGEFFLPVGEDTGWVRGAISRRGPPAPVV